MRTKFIKVSTADRLPEKEGKYLIYHKGFRTFLQSTFEPDDLEKVNYFRLNIEYWLLEVPDYEEEMKEMLEFIYGYGEKVEWSKVRPKLEELLTKLR